MPFPLTGASLTTSGVSTLVPSEASEPIGRTASTTATYSRSALLTTYSLPITSSASVTYTDNPPLGLFARTVVGSTVFTVGVFEHHDVTRTINPAPGVSSHSVYGIRTFLLLDTRRPNDLGASLKTGTNVSATMRLTVEAMNASVNASTTISAAMGYKRLFTGAINTSTSVTGSMAALPANDNFQNRRRIFDGARIYSNNEGATTQTVYPYNEFAYANYVKTVWFVWYPPMGSHAARAGAAVFTASSAQFRPQVRIYPARAVAAYNNDSPTLDIWNDTQVIPWFPWYGASYTDSDGVYHSWAYFDWYVQNPDTYAAPAEFFYIAVGALAATPSGGDFWLDYPPGTGPDGTIYSVTTSFEPVVLRGQTQFSSREPFVSGGTGYGSVDLGVLTPGELGNADTPALIRTSTSATADMTVDSPRILGVPLLTTLSRPEHRTDAIQVSSAAGIGVTNRAKPRTGAVIGSDEEALSTLPPYFV